MPALLLLAGLLTAGAQSGPKAGVPAPGPLPATEEVVRRALQRADWVREQGFEDRLLCEYLSIREELDENKDVKSPEEILYRVYPVDGYPYYERLSVDGKALTPEEMQRRKDEFRREIAESKADPKKDDTEIKFNEELIGRYETEVLGVELIHGRPAYVLAFEPKDGKLPVRRRIDHALNNSRGKIWIDQADFGLVRVQFELFRPVKLWGGIIGKMGDLEGRLDQVRVEEGVWLPQRADVYMKGRVVFKSFHQQRKMTWRGARLAPKELASY